MSTGAGNVLLVPGFLGSELNFESTALTEALGLNTVWLNPPRLASGGMKRLRFNVPESGFPVSGDDSVKPGKPLFSHYTPMIAYLQARGFDVYTPFADWRRPQLFDTALLVERIRELRDDWPLSILCHSRGGLLTRKALAMLAATGDQAAINRVVGCGVPHTGSMNAVALLGGFHSLLRTLIKIGRSLGPWLFSGLLPKTIYSVVRSWPAVYELLPAPGAPWLKGATASAFYSASMYEGSPIDPIPALLSLALAQWKDIPPVPAGFDWTDCVGAGVSTPCGLDGDGPVTSSDDLQYVMAGDGTVLTASAAQAPRRIIQYPCVHDMLLVDGRAWSPIVDALHGDLTDELTLIGGSVVRSS